MEEGITVWDGTGDLGSSFVLLLAPKASTTYVF